MTFEPQESEGPVIRDKRRIDPETGQVREPRPSAAPVTEEFDVADVTSGDGAAPPEPAEPVEPAGAEKVLAERTADLQRLQAEYVNYKRRVDRDRETVRSSAVATVVSALLPVLDDIGRAREHGEVTGGFKAVAESLERIVDGLGLSAFGTIGDTFDPHVHEALTHSYSDGVEGPVCSMIFQVGYRLGDRIVRPARVAVAEPAGAAKPAADVEAEPHEDGEHKAVGGDVEADEAR